VRIAGFTPQSELTLTTQLSHGVVYGRAEYEAPMVGTGMHWRAYIARVKSKANDTNNDSLETGFGLNKLLSTDRYGRWTGIAEISRRDSDAASLGAQTSFHKDDQVRLRLRAESQKDWVDSFRNEITLYAGMIDLSQNPDDQDKDRTTYQTAGSYQVIEARGGLNHVLDKDKLYTGSIRWVGQLASRNLEGYNNMSVGGILGVRAFSTIDGVGDQGLVTQFDLTRQITPSFYAGVLYDIGVVKAHKFNLVPSIDDNTSYTLQGAGWQLGGQVDQVSWNFSLAKSFGNKPSYWPSNQTVWGSWRANFMTTWAF
jgi:hemolysin activation/secretion protein